MVRTAIFVSRTWPNAALDELRQRYHVTVNTTDAPLTHKEWIEAMRGFDAICPTVTDRIAADVLGIADRRVRIIANFGAGYEHIDLAAAAYYGIVVTNTPDVLTQSTAELALLLMLMAARRAGEGERELRGGRWSGWRPTHLMGRSLSGRLLGLVGFGRIAQATARLARDALGMRLAYHSRNRADPGTDLEDAEYFPQLDDLLRAADCVSLHCPGGPATHHLIDRSRLALFKPAAILVNTARGSVIDEEALADALESGHLGSATVETRTAMGLRAAANLDAFFAGQTPRDRIA